MTRHQLFRASALGLVGGLVLLGAAACQKNSINGSATSDAGGAYGVVTNGSSGGQSSPSAAGGGYSQGNGGRDSGYAQPVSELAPTPPPPLPTYDQPPPPEAGDIWTPGYWAWNAAEEDYYWAPGTWVEPPRPGVYWTPGYWRYLANGYGFVPGYWGPTVGFYGGVNYGWGYGGDGYYGGRWRDNHFYYNQAANNLGDRHFEGVYREPVRIVNSDHASFNGGPHGVDMRVPPPQDQGPRNAHIPPTSAQREQVRLAAAQPALRASANHGAPPIVATTQPGKFHGPGVVTQVKSAPHYVAPPRPEASPPGERGPGPEASRATAPPPARAAAERQAPERPAPERPVQARPVPERPAPEARPAPEPRPAPQVRPTPTPPAERHAPPPVREAPHAQPPAPRPMEGRPVAPRPVETPRAPPPAARPVEAPHPVAAPRPAPPPTPHPAPPRPAEADRDKPHG